MATVQELVEQLQALSVEDPASVLETVTPPTHEASSREATQVLFPPRLSLFSGEPDKDARYTQWRAEVEGLQQNHAKSAILQAMRRSTKFLASDVLLHLPKEAPVAEILAKLDQCLDASNQQKSVTSSSTPPDSMLQSQQLLGPVVWNTSSAK